MEVLKLLVFLAIAWFGWRYIKKRHPASENKTTPPPDLRPWSGAIGSDVKGPPPSTAKPQKKSKQMQALHEQCRALLEPGAFSGDAVAYLLLDLRAAPASAKDANLVILESELESACEDKVLTPREQKEILFWLAVACGADAKLPAHMGGLDDDDDGDDDDSAHDQDPREAYLLENSELSAAGRYTFDYEDGRGNHSSRRVDILYIDGDYLEAFDHDADGMRTFRKTRIVGDVTDTDTGELFKPKELTRKRLGIRKIDFESLGL